MGNCHPSKKKMSTSASPRSTLVSQSDNFPFYLLVQSIFIQCRTGYSYVILSCICSAYLLDRVRDPTTPLLSKVKRGAEFENDMNNLHPVCSISFDFVYLTR